MYNTNIRGTLERNQQKRNTKIKCWKNKSLLVLFLEKVKLSQSISFFFSKWIWFFFIFITMFSLSIVTYIINNKKIHYNETEISILLSFFGLILGWLLFIKCPEKKSSLKLIDEKYEKNYKQQSWWTFYLFSLMKLSNIP